jgi:uncharacterized protein (TIGR00661 family)
MTQAIAAAQMMQRHGHEVVAVTVGTNPSRVVPEFFCRAFEGILTRLSSPGFSFQSSRGVATLATLRQAAAGLGDYRTSLKRLAQLIEHAQPDLIVNFLEPLTGLFNLLRPHPVPVISVGHHFMLDHPEFVCSPDFRLQQWMMRRYVRLAGARSTKLALSFYPAPNRPRQGLIVCPPLLRRELFDLPQDQAGRFLLVYVLNQAYAMDVLRWHATHPEVELHCFCEKPQVMPVWRSDATIWFHQLNGAKFLRLMAECRGVACTAGFESLNEAAWLGKPLLVVPVENHVEQHLNALDAERAGLARAAKRFDLTPLVGPWPSHRFGPYRSWVRRAEAIFLSTVESVGHPQVRTWMPTCPEPALSGGHG